MSRKNFYRTVGKRALDLGICVVAGIVLAPVSALIIIAIKFDSNGPAFYRQDRVGTNGKLFEMYKFRSMLTLEESYDASGKPLENYARVTRVGKILRATSIDELPQLINVLRGEMSLIGPRPTLKYQVERYSDRQKIRLQVKPGLTGWAQVNGRNSLTWEEKINFDIEYVKKLSLKLDYEILRRTVGVIFKQESVAFEKYDQLSEHKEDFRKEI